MTVGDDAQPKPQRLRLLIDTNVFIALEPYAGSMEAGLLPAARLLQLVSQQGHRVFVHPATRDDLVEGQDPARRRQRLAELAKFEMLEEVPLSSLAIARLGDSAVGTNDHRDLRLLAALHARAVTYLISEDDRLRRRAARAGLGDSVLTITEAVAVLAGFTPISAPPPPRVIKIATYALDIDQPIFESLRADYPGFDEWLDQRVRSDPDNRECLVVRDEEGDAYAALALVKLREPDCAHPLPQPVRKITTFKVSDRYAGRKYGELLLKAILVSAAHDDIASLYLEVLPRHQGLLDFLGDFGFSESARTERGEVVMAKRRLRADTAPVSPLGYHVALGPPAILGTANAFLVPIEPRWHRQLFPDAPGEDEISGVQLVFPGLVPAGQTHPWGNALRKAYLSQSQIKSLTPGDTLLFYRSSDRQAVTAIGVVEQVLRSRDPNEIAGFVGQRTVYTPTEIAVMCAESVDGVLAILFRQDRFVDPPWSLAEMQSHDVVTAWPQSITQVREGGAAWVRGQLTASP